MHDYSGLRNQIRILFWREMSLNRPTLFTLQGNIGSGKSTLLRLIQQRFPDIQVVLQPVQAWQKVGPGGSNLLDNFYKDIQKWGFPFQLLTVFTRLQKLRDRLKQPAVYLSERSIDCDLNVFSQEMVKCGLMDSAQRDMYLHMYQGFKSMFEHSQSKGIIYLRTPPQVCYQRLKRRNRSQEQTVSLAYLQDLDELHERWLQSQCLPKSVLRVDGRVNFVQDEGAKEEIVSQIQKFLKGNI